MSQAEMVRAPAVFPGTTAHGITPLPGAGGAGPLCESAQTPVSGRSTFPRASGNGHVRTGSPGVRGSADTGISGNG